MPSFKDPSFQDRAHQAADAKHKALEQLRRRPEPDQEVIGQRQAASARRDALKVEKAVAKRSAGEAAASAEAKAKAAIPTEAERKAARDARYAARQKRR